MNETVLFDRYCKRILLIDNVTSVDDISHRDESTLLTAEQKTIAATPRDLGRKPGDPIVDVGHLRVHRAGTRRTAPVMDGSRLEHSTCKLSRNVSGTGSTA